MLPPHFRSLMFCSCFCPISSPLSGYRFLHTFVFNILLLLFPVSSLLSSHCIHRRTCLQRSSKSRLSVPIVSRLAAIHPNLPHLATLSPRTSLLPALRPHTFTLSATSTLYNPHTLSRLSQCTYPALNFTLSIKSKPLKSLISL